MDSAIKRLITYNRQQIIADASSTPLAVKFRPWIQDFNLGATYTADMVEQEMKAITDAASSTPELLSGWMLWNPSNVYTKEALQAAND